ncbi:uncharacterized protein LOC111698841 [Eurytemora carolleeae]|uniref:uncharacterized protein LOC111698841 n=1 Tax=Eurytemora carolleeae TaxID=1294199 RepID=UPI000C75FCD7|nr:uncharacterized protein LOC111698841 [Eurytemora carolleeae]|eukprot:XP_023325061.1 uncharacterized protein LOC111698841 [Eurytemora affinis]
MSWLSEINIQPVLHLSRTTVLFLLLLQDYIGFGNSKIVGVGWIRPDGVVSVGGVLEVDDGVLQALNGDHDVLPVIRGVDDNHHSFHRQRREEKRICSFSIQDWTEVEGFCTFYGACRIRKNDYMYQGGCGDDTSGSVCKMDVRASKIIMGRCMLGNCVGEKKMKMLHSECPDSHSLGNIRILKKSSKNFKPERKRNPGDMKSSKNFESSKLKSHSTI